MRPLQLALFFSSLSSTACGGDTLRIGDDAVDASIAPAPRDAAARELPPALKARCDASMASEGVAGERAAELLPGRWAKCYGDGLGALHFDGLEFGAIDGASGPWFALAADGQGNYQRIDDAAHRGRYDSRPPVTVEIGFENGSTSSWIVLFDEPTSRFHVVRDLVTASDVLYVKL